MEQESKAPVIDWLPAQSVGPPAVLRLWKNNYKYFEILI